MATVLDTNALEVLLQELTSDIQSDVTELLHDKQLHSEVLTWLNSISSIESKEYLSSIPPPPSMGENSEAERTLVQDIAELEALQRSVDISLKGLIMEHKDDIVANQKELMESENLFKDRFINGFRDLWRNFNIDEQDENESSQQDFNADFSSLNDLELELEDKKIKSNSLKSALHSIRESSSVNMQNKSLSIVLENMDQITNILELPSLTGACIKAGYYSEALEIASYTRRLAIKFPQSEWIKRVELGIQQEMSHMLHGLIRLLKTDLKQSSLIKTLSYLRRIPPFSQSDDNSSGLLKRILLHARYQFIKSELDSLDHFAKERVYEKHLKRSIEVIREHCFSSIMIYKNVFPEDNETELQEVIIELTKLSKEDTTDESLTSESSINAEEKDIETNKNTNELEEKNNEDGDDNKARSNDEKKNHESTEQIDLIRAQAERLPSNILLFEFVENVVNSLLRSLFISLPHIKESSTRDGIYLQLIYCAQSLHRIDINFCDLMTSILLNAKNTETYLIDRACWTTAVVKQRDLSMSLLT